ncbi:MAG: peptidase M23 family protein [Parcubacteria group bacterium Gr01-1014_29]|nr:MAG: peptidase M23 family protein [Parcubacteria group bacterium Gr01-1014_29]
MDKAGCLSLSSHATIGCAGNISPRGRKSPYFTRVSRSSITIRFASISTKLQPPPPPRSPFHITRYVLKKAALFAVTALVALMFLPMQANAGLFSFLGSLFGAEAGENGGVELQNSLLTSLHTMPLLDAPVNVAAGKAARGGAALAIVDNNTLMPITGPLGSIADVDDVIKTDRITLYTVREGDNLSVIARMFGVSVETILWANDISRSNLIAPGDVLVILPVSGIKHTVKKGDTLESIAKKYKGNLEEILAFNNVSADTALAVGDEVIIPDGELSVPSPTRFSGSRSVVNTGLLKDAGGYYVRPVNGARSQGLHGFNGVDLAASCGAPIYASAPGTVIVSKRYGWNGGYGNYIVITHANGTQTLYAHNSANWVTSGQYVTQGQAIGAVGSTGRSTGCHVHFEVRGAKNPF